MELGRPGSVNLATEGENSTARINFLFRNLVIVALNIRADDECLLFSRSMLGIGLVTAHLAEGSTTKEWQHTIEFNTYPVSNGLFLTFQ